MGLFSCFSKPDAKGSKANPDTKSRAAPPTNNAGRAPAEEAATFKATKATTAEPTSVKATTTANPLVDHPRSTPAPDVNAVTAARSDNSPATPVDPAQQSPPATADMGQTPNATEEGAARASSGGAAGAAASPHAASVSPRSVGVDTRNGGTVEVEEQEEHSEQVDEHEQGEVEGEADGEGAAPNPRVAQYLQNLKEGVQGPSDYAPALREYTGEESDEPVAAFLMTLGGRPGLGPGLGLCRAAATRAVAGNAFGAAYRLHALSRACLVNRENGTKLDAAGQDALKALDAAGKRGSLPPASALEALDGALLAACDQLEPFTRQGWLLHLVCNESLKTDFDAAHNAIVGAVESAGLEVPGRMGPLAKGDHRDVGRGLRRSLKQLGGGSLAQGFKEAAQMDTLAHSIRDLAAQAGDGVTPEAVLAELALLPADVPADVYYARMVQPAERGVSAGGAEAGGNVPTLERYSAMFKWYDKDGTGLDRAALRTVLSDLGRLEGLRPADVEARLDQAFAIADRDGNGRISAHEFARYCETLTSSSARQELRLKVGIQKEEELKQIFTAFCSFGKGQARVEEMDSAAFAKLFRDCGLLAGKRDSATGGSSGPAAAASGDAQLQLTLRDIDLAFTRAKPRGGRKLTFDAFLTALTECAQRARGHVSGSDAFEQLVLAILRSDGPVVRATKAENVRLHDDKSTYTGVYAKGGPNVVEKPQDLAALIDRSDNAAPKKPAGAGTRNQSSLRAMKVDPDRTSNGGAGPAQDKRSSHTAGAPPLPPQHPNGQRASHPGETDVQRSSAGSAGWQSQSSRAAISSSGEPTGAGIVPPPQPNPALLEKWLLWVQWGAGGIPSHAPLHGRTEMGEAQFVKLLRETGLLDKEGPGALFTSRHADLVYAKVKGKGSTKLSFEAFERALALVAEGRKSSWEAVVGAILHAEGPAYTGAGNSGKALRA